MAPAFENTKTMRKEKQNKNKQTNKQKSISCSSLSYFSDLLQKDGFYLSYYCLWDFLFSSHSSGTADEPKSS